VLVSAGGQAAGSGSPPYDHPYLYREQGAHAEYEGVVWGENRVMDEKAWAEIEADVLGATEQDSGAAARP